MVTVSEEWIAIAILRLVEMEKAVVEGGGASGVAAVLAGLVPELAGKKVVIPLCGGNIDTTILGRCLDRGLAADGRLVKFSVTVSDRPGGIAELARTLCQLGVSIKDMMHERAWIKNDIFSVEVMCVVETKDSEQAIHMKNILEEKYDHLTITTIGVALGIEDDHDTSGESDKENENGDTFNTQATSPMPRSPLPTRRNIDAFSNKANQGLSIPVISVNSGRRGSMMVQTHVKTPQWKAPDVQTGGIDWSRRGTHYAVKEKE
jgi:predicted amino acid-binding ACT domain protein